jgi:hypothetical protein
MAQESFYNLRSKIVELFAANRSITSSQVEVVMKAMAELEYKLGASKERVPSMEDIDMMLYGNRLQTVDAGPTDEMQKEGVDLQKVSACRIDWACAYGKAARAREEAEYLTAQEQRLRAHLDKLIP